MEVATIVFGGPKSPKESRACSKGGDSKKCGVEVVSQLQKDAAKAEAAINGAKFLNSSRNAGGAVEMAKTLLSGGRKDAESIVVVLTSGGTNSRRKLRQAAFRLRQSARLVFIPVGQNAKNRKVKFLKRLASRPVNMNVLVAKNSASLLKNVGKLLPTICKAVEDPAATKTDEKN